VRVFRAGGGLRVHPNSRGWPVQALLGRGCSSFIDFSPSCGDSLLPCLGTEGGWPGLRAHPNSRGWPVQALLGRGCSCVTDFSPVAEIASSHAVGTETLPRISSASLPHLQLLSQTAKLRKRQLPYYLRVRARTSSTAVGSLRVHIRGDARTRAPAGKRARAWHAGTRHAIAVTGPGFTGC